MRGSHGWISFEAGKEGVSPYGHKRAMQLIGAIMVNAKARMGDILKRKGAQQAAPLRRIK